MSPSLSAHKSRRWGLRPNERRPFLLLGDFIAGFLALALALFLWANRSEEYLNPSLAFLLARPPVWFYLLPFGWMILIVELYDVHRAGNLRETVQGVSGSALLGFALYAFLYFYSDTRYLPRFGVAAFLLLVTPFTLLWRWAYIRIFTLPAFMRRVLIVGGGKAGRTVLQTIHGLAPAPFIVVGVIDDDPEKRGTEIESHQVLGGADQLLDLVAAHSISELIVAISGEMGGKLFQALLDAQEAGIDITSMQTAYEDLLARVPIFHLEADWILRSFVEESRVSSFYLLFKRLLDILGGLIGVLGIVVVSPFVGLAILLESGRPVFYTQTRSGRGDVSYELIKFRTMIQDAEKNGRAQWARENDERATHVGRFLRKTHLDELPQFINVLRGDMSLVGPRPERPELILHFQQHVPFYRARLLVKPGITGWAQIHQDYASNIEETYVKLEYDLYYIKHRSFLFDLLVLLRTPATVLGLRGR